MSTDLVVAPWWRRWLPSWLGGLRSTMALEGDGRDDDVLEARLVKEGGHKAGADFAAAQPAEPSYSVEQAMSAYGAIPWVYVCALAVCQDVARVPLRVYRGRRKGAETLPDHHPAVQLLLRPNSQTSYGQATRQRVLDRILTGTAYRRVLGVGRTPTGTLRMHPERVRLVPAPNGLVDHWVYRWMSEQKLSVDEVLWDHGPSWEQGPEGLYGQGVIRALHHLILADEAAWERQAESQRRGRPDAVVSPNEEDGGTWTDPQVKQIKAALQRAFDTSHGGVAVLGQRLKLDMLSWRPDQLGSGGIHGDVRTAVLSACGVPPARVGLDPGSFATAREQLRQYYQGTVMPLTLEFDESDTRLVERIDSRLWVERDYSDVAALQDDRTARLGRVKQWVDLGYETLVAAEIEGFWGLPAPTNKPLSTPGSKPLDGVDQKPTTTPKTPTEDGEPEAKPVEDDAELENAARWLAGVPDPNRDLEAVAAFVVGEQQGERP